MKECFGIKGLLSFVQVYSQILPYLNQVKNGFGFQELVHSRQFLDEIFGH
jgi:hypothetical protein